MGDTVKLKADLELVVHTIVKNTAAQLRDVKEQLTQQSQAAFEALDKKLTPGSLANPQKQQLDRMDGLNKLVKQFLRYAIGYSVLYKAAQAVSALTQGLLDLDEALFDIKAVANATTSQMDLMEASIKRVATTTKFTIQDIAQAGKVLAQTGLRGSDFTSALDATARFASAVGASIDLAADLVSTMRQVFSEMSDTSISNLLTKAINISKLTASDLKTILSLGTQTAKAYGISAEQFVASAATLRNAGIKASTVATGFRQALIEMFTLDSAAVKVISTRYRDIGEGISDQMIRARFFSFTQANNPLVAVLEELKRLGFAGSARQQFSRAFDVRAVNAILPLIDRIDELKTSEVELAFGNAALKASRTQMQSFNNTMKNLGATIGAFTDDILGGLIPGLTGMAKGLTDVVQLMREWNMETRAATGSGGEVTALGSLSGALAGGIAGKGAAGKLLSALAGGALGAAGGTAGVPVAANLGGDSVTIQKAISNLGGILLAFAVLKPIWNIFSKSPAAKLAKATKEGSKAAGGLSSGGFLSGLKKVSGPLILVFSALELLNLMFDFFGGSEVSTALKKLEAQTALLKEKLAVARGEYKEFKTYDLGGDTSTVGGQLTSMKGGLVESEVATRALFGTDSLSADVLVLVNLLTKMGAEAKSSSYRRIVQQLRDKTGASLDQPSKIILRMGNAISDSAKAITTAAKAMEANMKAADDTAAGDRTAAMTALLDARKHLFDTDQRAYVALTNSAANLADKLEVMLDVSEFVNDVGLKTLDEEIKKARERADAIAASVTKTLVVAASGDIDTRDAAFKRTMNTFLEAQKAAKMEEVDALRAWASLMVDVRNETADLRKQVEETEVRAGGAVSVGARPQPPATAAGGINMFPTKPSSSLDLSGLEEAAAASGLAANERARKIAAEILQVEEARIAELNATFMIASDKVISSGFAAVMEKAGESAKLAKAQEIASRGPRVVRDDEGKLQLSAAYKDLMVIVNEESKLRLLMAEDIRVDLRDYQENEATRKRQKAAAREIDQLRKKEFGLAGQGLVARDALNEKFNAQSEAVQNELDWTQFNLSLSVSLTMDYAALLKKRNALQEKAHDVQLAQLDANRDLSIAQKKYADAEAKRLLSAHIHAIKVVKSNEQQKIATERAPQAARGVAESTQQELRRLSLEVGELKAERDAQKLFAGRQAETAAGEKTRAGAEEAVGKLNLKLAETEAKINQLKISFDTALGNAFDFEDFISNLNATGVTVDKLGATIQDSLVNGFLSVGDAITDMAFEGADAMESLSAIARDLAKNLVNVIIQQQLVSAISSFGNKGPGVGTAVSPIASMLLSENAATGAIVSGRGTSTSDSMVGRLSVGEGVLNAKAVGDLGRSFVHAANAGAFKAASGGLSFENSKTRGGKDMFKPTVNVSVESPPGIPLQAEVVRQNNEMVVKLIAKQVEGQIANGVASGDGALNRALEGIGVGRARSLVR